MDDVLFLLGLNGELFDERCKAIFTTHRLACLEIFEGLAWVKIDFDFWHKSSPQLPV